MTPQIPVLFLPCRPAAILRLVVASWIDAVKRHSGWAWPHIGEEHAEVCAPSVAHRDALPAVEPVITRARCVATALHGAPNGVFARALRIGATVARIAGRSIGALFAPARPRVAVQQVFAHLDGRLPAVAEATPECARIGAWLSADDSQLAESLAGQILHLGQWHVSILSRAVTHV